MGWFSKDKKKKCPKCDMTFDDEERRWTHYYKIHKEKDRKIKYRKKNTYGVDQMSTQSDFRDG